MRRHALEVTDDDVHALTRAGYDEDDIFEQTVSAAVAAGPGAVGHRLTDAAMRLACVDAVEVERPLGVLKTLTYRPELFGRPYSAALDLGPARLDARRAGARPAWVSSLNLNGRRRRGQAEALVDAIHVPRSST